MTQYDDYTLDEGAKHQLKKDYIRSYIEAQVRSGNQPTEAQIKTQYNSVPETKINEWKRSGYSNVATGEVDEPVVTTETWLFDALISYIGTINLDVNYTTNGVQKTHMFYRGYGEEIPSPRAESYYTLFYGEEDTYNFTNLVYSNGNPCPTPWLIGWVDESYRTITLSEPATGDLLTFLQANATKQS